MVKSGKLSRSMLWKFALAGLVVSSLLVGCTLTAPGGGGGTNSSPNNQPFPENATPAQRLPLILNDEIGPGSSSPAVTGSAPGEDGFEVVVALEASNTAPKVGETLVLTATMTNQNASCEYPLYEMSLQSAENTPLTYESPQVLGPPGPNPAVFQAQFTEGGSFQVYARAYGERNCGQGWIWTYVTSDPLNLTIAP